MAKYGINQKGVQSLQKLAKDLKTFSGDIENSGNTLLGEAGRVQDELGEFADDIIELVRGVSKSQKNGKEAMKDLADNATKLANTIVTVLSQKV